MKMHICQVAFSRQAHWVAWVLRTQTIPDVWFLFDMEIIVIFLENQSEGKRTGATS